MRRVKEILRLRFELRFGQRQIARSCRMGLSTVHEHLERAEAAGVGWPLPEDWSEEELEAKLFGQQRFVESRLSAMELFTVVQNPQSCSRRGNAQLWSALNNSGNLRDGRGHKSDWCL
jgi:hypothetical protein